MTIKFDHYTSDAVTKHYWVANPHFKKGRSVGGGGGGGVCLDIFPPDLKNFVDKFIIMG